jgi:GxxExxY protein
MWLGMPISCPLRIRNLDQAEFDERDARVMRCAYAVQNALGRLCDERIYENELARRLRAHGFSSVHTQVPITVTHDGFVKEYRIDLVADDALYELKTVRDLLLNTMHRP